jgi:UDP-glucose 4-epimerase
MAHYRRLRFYRDLKTVCRFTEPAYGKSDDPSSQVRLIVGDIKDYDTCHCSCEDVDMIVHLAANTGVAPSVENPRSDMESNVIGTFNMLEAARKKGVKKFIFASSGAPIGECDPPIHEEKAARPVSPYGASKLAGEGYCSAYYRTFGVKTVALRFGNVYGPRSGHKSSVVAKFIRQAMEGETCEIYGDGSQTRDFIYIDDLIDAILKAADADMGGEVFQIATSKEHTVNEVAGMLRSQLAKAGITMKIEYGKVRLGDVKRNYSDTSKAKKRLGWEARTELPAGLEKTVAWFR